MQGLECCVRGNDARRQNKGCGIHIIRAGTSREAGGAIKRAKAHLGPKTHAQRLRRRRDKLCRAQRAMGLIGSEGHQELGLCAIHRCCLIFS